MDKIRVIFKVLLCVGLAIKVIGVGPKQIAYVKYGLKVGFLKINRYFDGLAEFSYKFCIIFLFF